MADGVDEGSAAMLCSVAEPAAWGVMRVGGGWRCIVDSEKQAAALCKGWDKAENWVHEAIPLYRSPTLTDEERLAVERAAITLEIREASKGSHQAGSGALVLRRLLERLG